MNNSKKGFSLIMLIVVVVILIIIAAIVMNKSSSTVKNAQYARFTHEFGDYTDSVTLNATDIKAKIGLEEKSKINNAQMYYMSANGLTSSKDLYISSFTVPIGYVMPDTLMKLFGYSEVIESAPNLSFNENALLTPYSEAIVDYTGSSFEIAYSYITKMGYLPIVCYVIDDHNIPGYKGTPNFKDGSSGYKFYGNTNGEEYHFITSNGQVFTLPGYPVNVEDGTKELHIGAEDNQYYVIVGNSELQVGDKNKNGDTIVESTPIIAANLARIGTWGTNYNHRTFSSYLYDPERSTFGLFGRYTSIGDPEGWKNYGTGSIKNSMHEYYEWLKTKQYGWADER